MCVCVSLIYIIIYHNLSKICQVLRSEEFVVQRFSVLQGFAELPIFQQLLFDCLLLRLACICRNEARYQC